MYHLVTSRCRYYLLDFRIYYIGQREFSEFTL